jgi:uncharacterized lipoprotein NlpE involved in copper resistance
MPPFRKTEKSKISPVWLIFLVIVIVLAIAGYQLAQTLKKIQPVTAPTSAPVTAHNIDGIYKGNLPCADCSGITETLILAKDGSYILEDLYQGKSTKPVQVQGKWAKTDAGILKLTPLGQTDVSYFQITSNGDLQMLDNNMQKIDSPFNQTLIKQN